MIINISKNKIEFNNDNWKNKIIINQNSKIKNNQK
jgi:hypothetical protein